MYCTSRRETSFRLSGGEASSALGAWPGQRLPIQLGPPASDMVLRSAAGFAWVLRSAPLPRPRPLPLCACTKQRAPSKSLPCRGLTSPHNALAASAMCHLPCVIYHVSSTMCHLPCVIYHVSSTMCHLPCVIYHLPHPRPDKTRAALHWQQLALAAALH
jgi:hypothetical protein